MSEVEFSEHYKGKEISNGLSYESFPSIILTGMYQTSRNILTGHLNSADTVQMNNSG